MGLKILQLSDLHIGKNIFDIEDLCINIEIALRDKKVDLILFTGDLIDGSFIKNKGYRNLAVKLFNDLIEELNRNKNNQLCKNDILFIPGNHEINRANYKKDGKLFDKYAEFINLFYENNIPEYYDTSNWSVFRKFEDEKLAFLGFNSANYTKDDSKNKEEDFGEIPMKQISSLTRKLDQIQNISEYNIVSFLHHHFYLIEERYKDYIDNSVLKNSETFLHNLNKYNLGLILHGHKHDSSDRRIFINSSIGEPEKISTVLGCGSIDKKDTFCNSFNYIEVFGIDDSLDLIYEQYSCKSSMSFAKTKEIKLPLKPMKNVKVNMLEMLKEDSYLERAYNNLKNIDTATPAEDIAKILDKTAGTLNDTAVKIAEDKRIIFYMLSAVHYRVNFYKNENKYLSEVEKFIKANLNQDFNEDGKTGCLFEILNSNSIYEVYSRYKKLRDRCTDLERSYLTFMMVSFFLTELYINIKNRSEDFYNIWIKSKSDLKFEKDSIYKNIEGNTIEIESDEDKRALGIKVVCKTATAHKITAMIIKEFEIILRQYEEDFSKIGFKIYYILPSISKLVSDNKIQLESYNFGAYIPTLIPLLAGENLYSQVEAFSRELIQNSVDAINMRKKLEKKMYEKELSEQGVISITIGDSNGGKYFEIIDNGTGMNKYLLERYFTTIGRSFYKSEDFNNLSVEYNPISKFGIGFLSCFLVAKKVEVFTRYFQNDEHNQEQKFYLDIPNFDGCFFIERENRGEIGTKIRIYENRDKNNFDEQRIYKYIISNILNVPYDINIKAPNSSIQETLHNNSFINNIISETSKNRLIFFIPFCNEKVIINDEIDMDRYCSDREYRDRYFNGILIYKKDSGLFGEQKITVTNSGILVQKSALISETITKLIGNYFDAFINFSSDLIDLEVSRDELKNTSKFIKYFKLQENEATFEEIFSSLKDKFLCKKTDLVQKLPYYILRNLNNKRYGMDKLILTFENNKYKIKYKNNPFLQDYLHVAETFYHINISDYSHKWEEGTFINIADDNIDNDLLKNSLINILAYKHLIVSNNIKDFSYMSRDRNMERARDMARDIVRDMDKARARDKARDMDMTRAVNRDLDMDMARNRARGIVKGRARDMERYIAGSMATTRDFNINMARDLDMGIARGMAREMARAMARTISRDMDIARDMVIDNGKRVDRIISNILCTIYFEYFEYIFDRYENYYMLFFDMLNGNTMLSIAASFFLNMSQLEEGFEVNVDEMKNIMSEIGSD